MRRVSAVAGQSSRHDAPRLWPAAAGLVVIIFQTVSVGGWASFAPHSFVTDFPGLGLRWIVDETAPSEHFVRDVGFLHLALGLVALRAGWQVVRGPRDIQRWELRGLGVGWSFFALLHLTFHATQTEGLDAMTMTTSLTSLALSLAAGVVLTLAPTVCRRRRR
ncbi:hypothetical protein ABZX12_26165 [Kribbella sp. NPDC003505]|uniref:hypothetical protein n=1 Tax=Kribbella sp. NPDC003505 TaxID=3154448 RepID=UPI0033B79A82